MELVDGAVKTPSRLVDRLPVLQSQVDQRHTVPPIARGGSGTRRADSCSSKSNAEAPDPVPAWFSSGIVPTPSVPRGAGADLSKGCQQLLPGRAPSL
jgi:hypothetical protein